MDFLSLDYLSYQSLSLEHPIIFLSTTICFSCLHRGRGVADFFLFKLSVCKPLNRLSQGLVLVTVSLPFRSSCWWQITFHSFSSTWIWIEELREIIDTQQLMLFSFHSNMCPRVVCEFSDCRVLLVKSLRTSNRALMPTGKRKYICSNLICVPMIKHLCCALKAFKDAKFLFYHLTFL